MKSKYRDERTLLKRRLLNSYAVAQMNRLVNGTTETRDIRGGCRQLDSIEAFIKEFVCFPTCPHIPGKPTDCFPRVM